MPVIRFIVFMVCVAIGYAYGDTQNSIPMWTAVGAVVGVLVAFIDYTFKLVGEIVEGIFD